MIALKTTYLIQCVLIPLMFCNGRADSTIRFSATFNGKAVTDDVAIVLMVDGKKIWPERTNNEFRIPSGVLNYEYVAVRFLFDGRLIEFPTIHRNKFDTEWALTIERFIGPGETKIRCASYRIRYTLKFMPAKYDGTTAFFEVCENN